MVDEAISSLRARLAEMANPERAVQEKRYLKSPFKFHGVSVSELRALVKEFRRENRRISKEALWDLCRPLWQSEYHEERALSMLLLEAYRPLLDYSDMASLERMLRESVNWDQVDHISVHLVGPVLEKDGRALDDLKRWSTDTNFWMRRAALLSQLLLFRAGRGDRPLFYSFADGMLEEKEFFIRKAIGWVLRDLSAAEPDEVYAYAVENRARMSGVTFREATRRLPERLRRRLGLPRR